MWFWVSYLKEYSWTLKSREFLSEQKHGGAGEMEVNQRTEEGGGETSSSITTDSRTNMNVLKSHAGGLPSKMRRL